MKISSEKQPPRRSKVYYNILSNSTHSGYITSLKDTCVYKIYDVLNVYIVSISYYNYACYKPLNIDRKNIRKKSLITALDIIKPTKYPKSKNSISMLVSTVFDKLKATKSYFWHRMGLKLKW